MDGGFEMKVAKFGGTSLANAEQIKKVCSIILADSERKVIVVSALVKGIAQIPRLLIYLLLAHKSTWRQVKQKLNLMLLLKGSKI